MSNEPNLVCVRECYGLTIAEIYKSKLVAAEIPVLLQYESAGVVLGITVDGLGRVRVMVPEEFSIEAESLLADVSDDEWPTDEWSAGQDWIEEEAQGDESSDS